MRTTLTLEEDIAIRLRAELRRSGRSLKETINELLRLGLDARRAAKAAKPFHVEARDLGLRAGFAVDNVWALIDQLEGPHTR